MAVLPFTIIGAAEPYLADGVTEAVTRELGHIEGARVIASNAAFTYRGRTDDARAIGRELGVEVLVRGSLQRAGERLRVSASLINAADNTTLWSQHYDRSTDDILSVQDDISWQVAAMLAARIGAAAPTRPAHAPKTTPDAYDAYLRGISEMRGGPGQLAGAIRELKRAVALDPNFALARAKLASAYTQQFFYNASDPALEQEAFIEIQRALAINPDLAEAYLARAQLTWNLRNGFPHERAIADLHRAIKANPSLAEAHVELGKVYVHVGLIDKSIAANQEALRLDPRATAATQRLIAAWIDGGRTRELIDALGRDPQWPARARATAFLYLGRTKDAIDTIIPRGASMAALRKIEMNEIALLAHAYAREKRAADAQTALRLAIPLAANATGLSDTHHAQFEIACAYALLGNPDKAVEWVTKAANEGYPSYPRISTEPDLQSLSAHPGFIKLLERLRQDYERWRTSL